jgi:hypothetical protein
LDRIQQEINSLTVYSQFGHKVVLLARAETCCGAKSAAEVKIFILPLQKLLSSRESRTAKADLARGRARPAVGPPCQCIFVAS